MKTADLLEVVYGEAAGEVAGGFTSSKLAEKAGQYVAEFDQREAERMARAEVTDALAGQGPLLDAFQRELVAAQNEAMFDNDLPALMTFDAYCMVKDASKQDLGDRGLKTASHFLYDRWNSDPLGTLTIGELKGFRDYFGDRFPKSAVKHTIDQAIVERGFNTLSDLPHLTRQASEVVDQESYERIVEANQLDGNRPEQVMGRAWIKAIAQRALHDERFEKQMPTLGDALHRAVGRYAQILEEAPEDSMNDLSEEMDDPISSPSEDELPHDEMSEEMATIESPISGEELVIELGLVEDQSVDGMEPEEGEIGVQPTSDALPHMSPYEVTAQLENFEGSDESEEDESEEAEETEEDPSAEEPEVQDGSILSVDTPYEDAVDVDLDFGEDSETETEMTEPTTTSIVDPSSGQELELSLTPIEEDLESSPPESDVDLTVEMDNLGRSSPMEHEAALSTKAIDEICTKLGLTASQIEESLLDGQELGVGDFRLAIKSDDQIHFTRGDKTLRVACLAEMDEVAQDFRLAAAAIYAPKTAAKAKTKTAKTAAPKVASYTITSDVPQAAPINARRIMASIWKIVPEAEGEFQDDGRLSIRVTAEEKAIARIQKILADVYGVRSFETRKTAQLTSQMMTQPLAPQTPTQSPYSGAPPIQRQPAGAPMQMMQAPMQTSQTGTGAQQQFISDHTDPLAAHAGDEQEASQHDQEGESWADEDLSTGISATAQLDEDLPPEDDLPIDEDMPLDDGLPIDDPTMDPTMDPTAPLGGDPMMGDPMMGGAPGMGMDPMMGGPPGLGGPPGMGGDIAPLDASQMPIDISSGRLQPQDEEAVRAALSTFRNTGSSPLGALKEFVTKFGPMLDRYGDESAPERAMAEAGVIRMLSEAFQQPAVIPAKGAARSADFKAPKVNTQQPSAVTVSKDFPEGDMPTVKKPKTQVVQQGKKTKSKDMRGHGNAESHDWANTSKPSPQSGSQAKNKGVKYPDKNMSKGTSGYGDTPATKHWDQVSKAPKMRSTKKGDLYIEFDPEFGEFPLRREEEVIWRHASFEAAVADAERRQFGTEAKIFVDDGYGGFEEL